MDAPDYEHLQGLVRRRAGLVLWSEKKFLADKRVADLARELGMSEDALMRAVRTDEEGDAARLVVEAMLPDETAFFRDHAMFADLAATVLPVLADRRAGPRRLRVLCAGMGSGQEAYAVAIVAAELAPRIGGDVEIVGTDLSRRAVARAAAGRYSQLEIQKGLSIQRILAHFHPVDDAVWEVSPALRRVVMVRAHNLLRPAPELGSFDLVLFRNVLTTADCSIRSAMLATVLERLAPEGTLMLGASETLIGLGSPLLPLAGLRGFYARAAGPTARAAPLRAAAVS